MSIIADASQMLETLRAGDKRTVHCIVGGISEAYTAETLQALNTNVSMTHDSREVVDFVSNAHALLIQLGTLTELRESGMATAIDTARRHGKPWVLEPRLAGRSQFRAELARSLAENRPRIVCGTPREFSAMMRSQRTLPLATILKAFKSTFVQCGSTNVVANALQNVRIDNGSAFLSRSNALHCVFASICAAFASIESDGFKAACSAMLVAGIAGERASREARGMGSFLVAFLDQLSLLTAADLVESARCAPLEELAS